MYNINYHVQKRSKRNSWRKNVSGLINKKIINCNMNVNVNDEKLEYKYKIIDGISKIKGGVNVLKDLKYPEEIIENTKNIISDLII